MLQEGHPAPTFSLPDADMETVCLDQFKGHKNIVLYFYPKDGSLPCTMEAIEFTDQEEAFARHNTVVMGVSSDDCITHQEFRDSNGVSINLLADVDGEVCKQYGVWQEREMNGMIRRGIQRSTFVIDRDGVVRHAAYGVSPRGHAREVLNLVKELKLS